MRTGTVISLGASAVLGFGAGLVHYAIFG